MNVLAIGNSFSVNAMTYLHDIASADGFPLTCVTLFIGGCSLARHHRNMHSGEEAYDIQYNGSMTDFFTSIDKACLSREWDVITFQQASHFSAYYDTYQPYLSELAAHVRDLVPKAKFMIHETWAYEAESERLRQNGFSDQKDMYNALHHAYSRAAADIGADGIIPCGTFFQYLIAAQDTASPFKLHRDTFHATQGLGCYALGAVWYKTLTGRNMTGNSFRNFEEPIPEEQVILVQKLADELL